MSDAHVHPEKTVRLFLKNAPHEIACGRLRAFHRAAYPAIPARIQPGKGMNQHPYPLSRQIQSLPFLDQIRITQTVQLLNLRHHGFRSVKFPADGIKRISGLYHVGDAGGSGGTFGRRSGGCLRRCGGGCLLRHRFGWSRLRRRRTLRFAGGFFWLRSRFTPPCLRPSHCGACTFFRLRGRGQSLLGRDRRRFTRSVV